MKKYLLISNDKIFIRKKKISSNFNDTVNIIESIGKKFQIFLLARNVKRENSFSTKIKNKISGVNFREISNIHKNSNFKIFMISLTLRNLINFFVIKFLIKKISGYLYLRSDGHKEYKKKIGFIGFLFYDIMLNQLKKNLKIISVSNKIYHSSSKLIIFPSELNHLWFSKDKKINTDQAKLLYLGRIKEEKGIFSLLELVKNFKIDFKLSIVGGDKYLKRNSKITFFKQISNQREIIKLYDRHNIFILPSYTEGAPKVLIESLARLRPVIIFNEIKHIKLKFKGIFICNRKSHDLEKKIKYILKNYIKIQKSMKKNILPTKKSFQKELINILDDSFKR